MICVDYILLHPIWNTNFKAYPAVWVSAKYFPPFSTPGWNSISVEPSDAPITLALHMSRRSSTPSFRIDNFLGHPLITKIKISNLSDVELLIHLFVDQPEFSILWLVDRLRHCKREPFEGFDHPKGAKQFILLWMFLDLKRLVNVAILWEFLRCNVRPHYNLILSF